MSYEDECFKAAIDKGTLDALLPDTEHAAVAKRLLDEVWRVIRLMGVQLIVTLAQDHVIKTLIHSYGDK